MEYTRELDPDITIALLPWYMADDMTIVEVGMELDRRMKQLSDDTFVLVASENGKIHGMLIAYARYKDVFVWQMKIDRKCDAKRMVNILYEWARGKGLSKIAAISHRPKAICRRFGYTQEGNEIVRGI